MKSAAAAAAVMLAALLTGCCGGEVPSETGRPAETAEETKAETTSDATETSSAGLAHAETTPAAQADKTEETKAGAQNSAPAGTDDESDSIKETAKAGNAAEAYGRKAAEQAGPNEETAAGSAPEDPAWQQSDSHEHDWVAVTHEEPVYETVYHEAVTETVWIVDGTVPVYEYHDVCDCGFDFTAAGYDDSDIYIHQREHALKGESDGWATCRVQTGEESFGHYETVTVQAAWSETVQSGSVTVTDYYYCPVCSATSRK